MPSKGLGGQSRDSKRKTCKREVTETLARIKESEAGAVPQGSGSVCGGCRSRFEEGAGQ